MGEGEGEGEGNSARAEWKVLKIDSTRERNFGDFSAIAKTAGSNLGVQEKA